MDTAILATGLPCFDFIGIITSESREKGLSRSQELFSLTIKFECSIYTYNSDHLVTFSRSERQNYVLGDSEHKKTLPPLRIELYTTADSVDPDEMAKYCKIRNFREDFIFRETSHMQSFVKIKPS